MYHKGTSIKEFSAASSRSATERFSRSQIERVDGFPRAILEQAFDALMEGDYELSPHALAELDRVSDSNLMRWLHYRYRYDTFPITRTVEGYPPCVQIEPTSICNYRCVFCFQTDKSFTKATNGHMGSMSVDLFKRVVDQLQGNVEAVTLASRGEPLLGRHIEEMLAYLAGKFLALKINTNAWYLDEAMAHAILQAEPATLVISADSADPDTYAKLRVRGDLHRVLENVATLAVIRAKHYPKSKTIIRVSGVKYSEEQSFTDMLYLWDDIVDQVAFVDYNPWENTYEAPENDIVEPCSDLWRRMFVWWDGKVNPCDVDYKSALSVGDARSTDLLSLWHGPAYQGLRMEHLGGLRRNKIPCKSCAVV